MIAAGTAPAPAAEPSLPVDCLPDAVLRWEAVDPELRYGARDVPGIVLGHPGDSSPTTGTTTVASLGRGGSVTFELIDVVIEDRPGPDFIVFENAFFQGAPPAGPDDDYLVFHEPGFVDVSADGTAWVRFPYDPDALAQAATVGAIDRALHRALRGLAGITPTFTGNWTIPDDPESWDPAGIGGVSGAGGDAFDLATVGLTEARFVRITDAATGNGFPGAAEGFDMDALVVLHGRPRGSAAPDADGDGLSDAVERTVWGTRTDLADTDGDGTDDGREVAGCRDPLSASVDPFLQREPRVFVEDAACSEIHWTWLGASAGWDVLRGDVAWLAESGGLVDTGPLSCLARAVAGASWSCDGESPPAGGCWYYLVRRAGDGTGPGTAGRSSNLAERDAGGACP
ncbi:MAG: hypothetical protein Kow0062_17830 [Acidobacteriota bacterium]